MRIAYNGALLSRHFSGVEVAIFGLVRALAEFGRHDYTLFVPPRSSAAACGNERLTVCSTRLPTRLRPFRVLWEQAVLPHTVTRDAFDLLHAPGYIAPLSAGVPVVLTVYDLIALKFPEWCHATNRWHYSFMLPRSIRRADAIIVPSEATRRDVVEWFPDVEERLTTIPLGIRDDFRPVIDATVRADVRSRLGLPEHFVLFVGNTEPKKNLVRLLDAYSRLKRENTVVPDFVIAGCDAWGHDAVVGRIKTLGLGDNVHVLGFVPQADLPCLYSMASLCAFPSLYEGFGLPPLEAMACGVPVLTSDRGSLPEVVADASLVVDPENVDSMAAGLNRLLCDSELRAALVARGRERADRYTWRRAVAATEELYERIAAGTA